MGNQELEPKTTRHPCSPLPLENDINHQPLLVLKSSLGSDGYVIVYRDQRLPHRDTKKAARKYAVNWARNHPYGKVGSYKQMKQYAGNNTPGNTAKYNDLVLVALGTRGDHFQNGAPSGEWAVYKDGRQIEVISAARMKRNGTLDVELNKLAR